MSPNIELHALAFAGVLIHYLKEWVSANKKGEKYDLKKALPMAALAALCTGLLVHVKDDMKDIYPMTRFSVIVLGYFGNSIFFSLMDTKKPKFEK